MSTQALSVIPDQSSSLEPVELTVTEIVAKVGKVREVAEKVMKKDIHYGVIPGTPKPTLYKPGGEILGLTFRLAPRYEGDKSSIDLGNGHREYIIRCDLYHIHTGLFYGSGVGSCSTLEAKYRYRTGPKEFTDQPVPKEYWNVRNSDRVKAQEMIGGPGFSVGKNESGSWVVCIQGEKVEHDNPADYYNTVLKMAAKRAYIDAILKATAASEVYTQDLEDMHENDQANGYTAPTSETKPPIQPPQRKSETQAASNGSSPHCPTCNGKMKYVAEGITKNGKNAGKKHDAFWSCETKDCKGFMWAKDFKPAQESDSSSELITEKESSDLWGVGYRAIPGVRQSLEKHQIESIVAAFGYKDFTQIKRIHYDAIKSALEKGEVPTSDPEPK